MGLSVAASGHVPIGIRCLGRRVVRAYQFYFGVSGDVPIVGDWDCDGFDTPGVFRPSNGSIYMRNDIAIGSSLETIDTCG